MVNIDKKGIRYFYSVLRKQLIHLNLQLLYTCNYKCRICDFWKEEYKNAPQLSLEQIEAIAEKIKPLGPQIISIGGGEPLMHKDIVGITRTLAKDNFPVMICNGWFVTPEISRDLFDAGMYEVSISVDYSDAEKHDRQRGKKGSYDRAVKALETLQRNRTRPWQRVHMISVVMEDNIDQIEDLILLAKDIGVTYLVTLYSDGRGKKHRQFNDVDLSARLMNLKNKYKDFLALPGYLSKFTESVRNISGISPCYAGKNLYNIDSSGNVTLCIDRLDDPVGNIFENDIRSIRSALLDKHKKNTCGECWTSCRGAIEALMYDNDKIANWKAMYRSVKNIPINNLNN